MTELMAAFAEVARFAGHLADDRDALAMARDVPEPRDHDAIARAAGAHGDHRCSLRMAFWRLEKLAAGDLPYPEAP